MKHLIGLVCLTLLFVNCNQSNHTQTLGGSQNLDSIININEKPTKSASTINKDLIEGIWALDDTSNAVFIIHKNSITFFAEINKKYKYKISDDTLFFIFEDYITKNQILKLDEDSLVLQIQDGEVGHYYNRRR